ncbi:sulfuric ester hydrolase [Aureococcus anophagefferens]|nr:sulfuric ester hydrolase [Aureococcus anophagefferens]
MSVGKPHIVLAIVDDLGYGDVGYNNRELHAATPTMNKLASGGVTLTSFYASPTCTASRAALFTGKYPMHLGLQDSVIHPSEPRGVPLKETFLSQKLKDAGYGTVFVGKWHLGFHQAAYTPSQRGFDEFFGILTGGGDHVARAHESFAIAPDYKSKITTMTGSNLWHNGRPVGEDEEGVRDTHSTHLYTAKSRAYVAKYAEMADVPLFLTVSYQAVHAPIQVPDEYVDGSAYANGCESLAGSASAALRRQLCGMVSMGSYYEGGIRVPAFVSGGYLAKHLSAGRVFEGLVHITDLHATALRVAGVSSKEDKRAAPAVAAAKVGHLRRLEPGQQPQSYAETALDDVLSHEHLTDSLDGVDQWDAFVSGASAAASQRTHVAHNINSELFGAAGALRVGEYKLIVEARVTESEIYEYGQHMLQDDNWDQSELSQVIHQKLLRTPGTTSLFDVVANPNELDEDDCDDARSCRNLYDLDEFADVKATILEKWAELRDSTPESTEIWLDDGPLADPALFGGVWTPWRDDLGMPYATYQLATKTVHNTLGGDNKPKPAEAAEASAEQTNAGHNRRLAESRGGGASVATLALGAALGYAGAQLRR